MTVTVNTFDTTDSTVNIAAAIEIVATGIGTSDKLVFIRTNGSKAIVAKIDSP